MKKRLLLLFLFLLLCGCDEHLATEYGSRSVPMGGMSVNGTTVLGNLFEQNGHKVSSRRDLSPMLADRATTIVWAPNSFEAPTAEAVEWFNDWLAADPTHTLIFIGRDYNAETAYWNAIIPGAPANKEPELKRRRNEAQLDRTNERKGISDGRCEWFSFKYGDPHRNADTLSGPWAAGVDPQKGTIELDGRILPDPADTVDTLLSSGADPLVWRLPSVQGGGNIIVVANGSFLLNYPLLNHEHRKLAGKLVAEVDPTGTVVFLETGHGGPMVREEDAGYEIPGGLAMFTVWPLSVLLLHLAALGVVFCVCMWPIFGRPVSPKREALSDFGKHIDALGEMLELTGDHSYATIRVLQYQQAQRGEAVPPSAFRGPTAPQTGQTEGAPPAAVQTGRRSPAPSRKPLST